MMPIREFTAGKAEPRIGGFAHQFGDSEVRHQQPWNSCRTKSRVLLPCPWLAAIL